MAITSLKADVVAAITADAVISNQLNTAMFSDTDGFGLMAWKVANSTADAEYFILFYRDNPKNGVSIQMRDYVADDNKITIRYDMGQAEILQANDLLALLLSLVDRLYNTVK